MNIQDIDQARRDRKHIFEQKIEEQITLPNQKRTAYIMEILGIYHSGTYPYSLLNQKEYSQQEDTSIYKYENMVCEIFMLGNSIKYKIKALKKIIYLDNFMLLISGLKYKLSEKEKNQIRDIFHARYPDLIKNKDIPHPSEQAGTISDIFETK